MLTKDEKAVLKLVHACLENISKLPPQVFVALDELTTVMLAQDLATVRKAFTKFYETTQKEAN